MNESGTYHIEVRFVDVIIKNTTSYSFYAVVNDSIVKLYYNIHVKGIRKIGQMQSSPETLRHKITQNNSEIWARHNNPDPGGWSIWLDGILTKAN